MIKTHIMQLRPYDYNGKRGVSDKPYKKLFCSDINYLFNEGYDKLQTLIEPSESYNLFYTLCDIEPKEMTKNGKKYINKRGFIAQEVIPFDLDHIFMEQWQEYLHPVAIVLGIPLDEMIIVKSGNGLQFIVKSAETWTDVKYFSTHKQTYLNLCKQIQTSLQTLGLPVDVDTSVWSPGRLMRLPGTMNRKPVDDPFSPNAVVKLAERTQYHTLRGAGLRLATDTALTKTEVKTEKSQQDFLRPDHEYIKEQCLFIKSCLDGSLEVHEPQCYAFLGIAAFFDDNDVTAWEGLNKFSSPTIDKMDKAAKLAQARDKTPPRTCTDISGRWDGCENCPHNGHIKTPLQLREQSFAIDMAYNGELGTTPKEMEVVAFICGKLGINFSPAKGEVNWEDSDFLKEGEDVDEQKKDYFRWNGKYWELLTQATLTKIKSYINKAYGYNAGYAKIQSTYKFFLQTIPQNPKEDLHTSKHNKANFQNGTLHAIPDPQGNLTLTFKPHSKRDHLTYALPGDYSETSEPNTEFEDMLQRIFAGDTDKDQKIKAIQQMFGGCIMPMYPRIFFLIGRTGGGKSTILKTLSYLIGMKNISGVPLTGKDFDFAQMVGKNVNMVLDIAEGVPIREDILKQVEDRFPVTIKRKFKSDLQLPFPPMQLFGGNNLPPNFEKSGALKRRVTIITWNTSITDGEDNLSPEERKSKKEYASWCFNLNPQGVLNFALKGLRNLVEECHGHYVNPDSGKDELNQWQYSNDRVQQFLDDIEEGAVSSITRGAEERISKTKFHEAYCEYIKMLPEYTTRTPLLSRMHFYSVLQKKGIKEKRFTDSRCYIGYGHIASEY